MRNKNDGSFSEMLSEEDLITILEKLKETEKQKREGSVSLSDNYIFNPTINFDNERVLSVLPMENSFLIK